MREINISEIISTVRDLCIESNYYLSSDVKESICKAKEDETWPLAENVLDRLILKLQYCSKEKICQYVKIQVWHVYL